MGRIMGIDFGERRIGVALSDPLGMAAHPFSIITRRSNADDIAAIETAARENEVIRIVIGLPLNMDGTPGRLTENVQRFGRLLEEKLKLPVEYYDERLTTWEAERILVEEADMSREKRKKVRDKLAASFILQAYLDKHPGQL